MKKEIIEKLNRINREFYEKAAASFDSKRKGLFGGIDNFISYLEKRRFVPKFILDIACGNGKFYQVLHKAFPKAKYVGIDSSLPLVKIAKKRNISPNAGFVHIDVFDYLKLPNETKFDLIILITFLHHISGREERIKLIKGMCKLLSPKGLIVVTFWQFMENEKLKGKTLPWGKVGIDSKDLEENDYLLGWDKQENTYRYCHYFDDKEIDEIISKAGLKLVHWYIQEDKFGKLNKIVILGTGPTSKVNPEN